MSRAGLWRRQLAGALVAALLAAGTFAFVRAMYRLPSRAKDPVAPAQAAPTPVLVVTPADPRAPERQGAAGGAWLALATLPAEQATAVLDDLAAALASAEGRTLPGAVDLLDESPEEVLQGVQSWFLPIYTAASALVAGRWRAPDGSVIVEARAASAGQPAAPAKRVELVSEETQGDPDGRMARFAAWPVSRAERVRCASREQASSAVVAMRRYVAAPAGHIAVVVSGAAGENRLDGDLVDRARALARRILRPGRADAGESTPMQRLAGELRDGPRERSPSWLALGDAEAFVVPRLGSLARLSEFRAQIDDTIGRLGGGCARLR